jgi:hypothetical protein
MASRIHGLSSGSANQRTGGLAVVQLGATAAGSFMITVTPPS